MTRTVTGAVIALSLWLTPGCDQGVETNRSDRVTAGKEADDDIPTPLPRADGGPESGDEGGDIPPAPSPDEGTEGEKPEGDSSAGSGDGSGGGGCGSGGSGGGCGSGGSDGCGSGGSCSGGCSY